MNLRLLIWVTSDCNLDCPLCSHKFTRKQYTKYQMNILEVHSIVNSIKKRGIKIDTIEITGGEPSLWNNLEQGVSLFKEVCNHVTLVTNGNNPPRIINLNLPHWIVSSSQATPEQLRQYKNYNITYNSHKHKPLPIQSIPNSLPGECCVRTDCFGKPQNSLLYLCGKVYYCCNTPALIQRTPLRESLYCDFYDDFVTKFQDKKFYESICSWCICNAKVWKQI